MSRNQRIGLLVAAAVVVVVAIVIAVASGGGDERGSGGADQHRHPSDQHDGDGSTPTETPPREPDSSRIQIKDGRPSAGRQNIKVKKGDNVTIVVSADAPRR